MTQPRSPVSEFLNRINYSESGSTRKRRVSSVAIGVKSALLRSTDVARKFGSTSVPNSPDGSSGMRPSWMRERAMSDPMMNLDMDKSLPDLPGNLAEVYRALNRDTTPVGLFEKYLNKIGKFTRRIVEPCSNASTGDGMDGEQNITGMIPLSLSPDLLLDSPIGQQIQSGINTFLDGMPVLMKALNEVAKLHPFVGGQSVSSIIITRV